MVPSPTDTPTYKFFDVQTVNFNLLILIARQLSSYKLPPAVPNWHSCFFGQSKSERVVFCFYLVVFFGVILDTSLFIAMAPKKDELKSVK